MRFTKCSVLMVIVTMCIIAGCKKSKSDFSKLMRELNWIDTKIFSLGEDIEKIKNDVKEINSEINSLAKNNCDEFNSIKTIEGVVDDIRDEIIIERPRVSPAQAYIFGRNSANDIKEPSLAKRIINLEYTVNQLSKSVDILVKSADQSKLNSNKIYTYESYSPNCKDDI